MIDQKYALMLRSKEVAHGCTPPKVPEGTWFVVTSPAWHGEMGFFMCQKGHGPHNPGHFPGNAILFESLEEALAFRPPENVLKAFKDWWFDPDGGACAVPVRPVWLPRHSGEIMDGYEAIGEGNALPSILLPQEERLREWDRMMEWSAM